MSATQIIFGRFVFKICLPLGIEETASAARVCTLLLERNGVIS
jgi:hypothetical protein